jgi:hypothetical protein
LNLQRALSVVLFNKASAAEVPAARLVSMLASDEPSALGATRALASRDDARQTARITPLLSSPDRDFRAAALAGLGRNPGREHTGTLARAYAFEVDAGVRLEVVQALSQRPRSAERARVLQQAADYDVDAAVRAVARQRIAAQAGTVSDEVAWVETIDARGLYPVLMFARGVALALPLPPDGTLVALGLPAEPDYVRWAGSSGPLPRVDNGGKPK